MAGNHDGGVARATIPAFSGLGRREGSRELRSTRLFSEEIIPKVARSTAEFQMAATPTRSNGGNCCRCRNYRLTLDILSVRNWKTLATSHTFASISFPTEAS